MAVKLAYVVECFRDEPKLVSRGENVYNSSRTEYFAYDPTSGIIKGKVRSSLKDRSYSKSLAIAKIPLGALRQLTFSTAAKTMRFTNHACFSDSCLNIS